MASAALSASNIRLLAQYGTTYWEDEASVNGVWVGLLAKAFPGSDGFVLQPEGQGEGSRMRNDILVRKITDFQTGTQDAYLVFEGKSSKGDSLNDAAKQLLNFVRASPKLNGVERLWGIVARGTEFQLLFYLQGQEYKLKLPKPNAGNPEPGKPSLGPPSPNYTLARALDEAGSVESVEFFLAYARTHIKSWVP